MRPADPHAVDPRCPDTLPGAAMEDWSYRTAGDSRCRQRPHKVLRNTDEPARRLLRNRSREPFAGGAVVGARTQGGADCRIEFSVGRERVGGAGDDIDQPTDSYLHTIDNAVRVGRPAHDRSLFSQSFRESSDATHRASGSMGTCRASIATLAKRKTNGPVRVDVERIRPRDE